MLFQPRAFPSLLILFFIAGPTGAAGPPADIPAGGRLGGRLGRIAALVKARGPFDPSVRENLERLARFNQVDLDSAPPWVQVHLLFDRVDLNPLRAAGGKIHGRMGQVVSVRVPVDALEALARVPGVLSVQPARRYNLHMDISRPEMGAQAATDQFALTGAGTLVAVVDTGIDWTHSDFRNPDRTTRIAAIWDQTDDSGTPPAGFDFGTFYSRTDIDTALNFMLPLMTGDGFGHGTHVTGTAAGNGRGTGNGEPPGVYVGIAHAADILVVRVFDDTASFCGLCDLVAALDFIDQQAAALGKPVVVNMSLGSQYGPHDGTETDDLAINAFTGLGRAVVISAGNSGNSGIHTEGDAVNGGPVTARSFTIPAYTPSGGDGVFMNLWHDPADSMTTRIISPGGTFTLTHTSGDGQVFIDTDDGRLLIWDFIDPVLGNGDRELVIDISDAGGTAPRGGDGVDGLWTIDIQSLPIAVFGSGHFDIWTYFSDLGGKRAGAWNVNANNELVGSPATAQKAIAVGAYTTRACWPSLSSPNTCYGTPPTIGQIAGFSSPGPIRDDPVRDALDPTRVRRKPDISASGFGIVSALSSEPMARPTDPWVTPDEAHRNWQGTSMSAPHVAGAVALLFQANPAIGGLQARKFLRRNAREDLFSTAGNVWGWGKIDIATAVDDLLNLITDLAIDPATDAFTATGPADATTFNVYRGSLSALDGNFYGTCFLSGLPAPDFQDTTPEPAAGQGFFYLMTGLEVSNLTIEGSLGQTSAGTLRPNLNPCP